MTTLRTITLVGLVLCAGMLVRSIMVAWAYRQRREPLPQYYAGNVAGGLATMLLLGGTLVTDHELLHWVFVIAAVVCIAIDMFQSRRGIP